MAHPRTPSVPFGTSPPQGGDRWRASLAPQDEANSSADTMPIVLGWQRCGLPISPLVGEMSRKGQRGYQRCGKRIGRSYRRNSALILSDWLPIDGAAKLFLALIPLTRIGLAVVRTETPSSRLTVCSMSSWRKADVCSSFGQSNTSAAQISAGSNISSHSLIVFCCRQLAIRLLISSRR